MPKQPTIQSQLARGLQVKGYLEHTATRYHDGTRSFYHPDTPTRRIFVGPSGSFRAGQNRLVSMVISKRFTEEVKAAGMVALLADKGKRS
jgi:hypothetical protein